jgi:Glycosyltransferase family 87
MFFLFLILSTYAGEHVLRPLLGNSEGKFSRHFNYDWTESKLGYDNLAGFEGYQALRKKEAMYTKTTHRPFNLNSLPQSLIYFIPQTQLSPKKSYHLTLFLTLVATSVSFLAIAAQIGQHFESYLLLFLPMLFGISAPGLITLDSGNIGGLGSACVLFGLVFILRNRPTYSAFLFGLACCLKPLFFPFFFLLLFLESSKRSVAVFGTVQVLALFICCSINHDFLLLLTYFKKISFFVQSQQNWFSDSVGLQALGAHVAQRIGHPELIPALMSLKGSLVIGTIFSLPLLWYLKLTFEDQSQKVQVTSLLIIAYCTFFSVLWEPVVSLYNTLHVLVLLPIIDFIFEKYPQKTIRVFCFLTLGFLAVIFLSPDILVERKVTLSLYTSLAFLSFLILAGFLIHLSKENQAICEPLNKSNVPS